MTNLSTRPGDGYVRAGIDAARAGQFQVARRCLEQALAQEPDHTLAMFWMAFVAKTPQASVIWLEQVLAREPENARAKAGLVWARERLSAAAAAPKKAERPDFSTRAHDGDDEPLSPGARTSGPVPQARRVFSLRTALLLLFGLSLLALSGWWGLGQPPPDSLAAWLPAPLVSQTVHLSGAAPLPPEPVIPVIPAISEEPGNHSFSQASALKYTSVADTILVDLVDNVARDVPTSSNGDEAPDGMGGAIGPAIDAVSSLDTEKMSLDEGLDDDAIAPVRFETDRTNPLALVGPADELLDGVRLFVPVNEEELVHQPASPNEKWIEVNVTTQRVTAWEGNVPVMSFVTSTGLPDTPTVLGEFNIYWKLESTLMMGDDYYLPAVPYTMYFYRGYGLHGAYWHNNFGQPMSHGCVNLSIDDSKTLFEWADPVVPPSQTQVVASADNPGTLVVVHQ